MSPLRNALPLALVVGALAASPALAQESDDDAPVLPSRVAKALDRTSASLDNAQEHLDEGEYSQAVVSLRGLRNNMYRADRAVARVMAAPVDPEAETSSAPDSVIALLATEHDIVVGLAGLFDTHSLGVVDGLTHAVNRTISARDKLLDKVIGLDPEGAGADYADGMADTVGDYDDEVANVNEALTDDALSVGGTKVLQSVLTRVQATDAKVTAAFGGGE